MGLPDERTKHERRPLIAAVLAAVIEKPSHGYEIAVRLDRRVGNLKVDRRRVYEALTQLEVEGFVQSEQTRSEGPGGWRRVYTGTERGEQARAAWIQELQAFPVGRSDISVWMVFSTPEESPQILAALDECEKDCMEMAEGSTEAVVRRASWRSRMLDLSRETVREQIEVEIRWIKRARREIEEYLAESR
jgi:DNA-binding PadR family transcriptional regulator